jgi:hypothetical protein
VLKLDSGETVQPNAGDTLIHNGSRHAWGNPGTVPVRAPHRVDRRDAEGLESGL